MKKLLFSIAVIAGVAFTSKAQNCGVLATCTPTPLDTPDLLPHTADMPCFQQGSPVNQTLTFRNYTKFDNTQTPAPGDSFTVDKLEFTAITLPSGLCWKMVDATNSINGGALGCIQVEGTPTAACGQYKLGIQFKAYVNGIPVGVPYNADDLPLYYWVRITAPGSTDCPDLDTLSGAGHGKETAFIPYGTCTAGINDITANISNVTVSPNPFGTATTVSFFSEKRENYSVKMTNLLGAVIYSEEIVSKNGGNNNVEIKNRNYANGVYLISITNGKSNITKRVIIQE